MSSLRLFKFHFKTCRLPSSRSLVVLNWRYLLIVLVFGTPVKATEWVLVKSEQTSSDKVLHWEPMLNNTSLRDLSKVRWEPVAEKLSRPKIVWEKLPPGELESPDKAQSGAEVSRARVKPSPPPKLYAFNRSIAFGDHIVGPDIAWRIPTGFQWTPHHWIDASVSGFSRNPKDENFWAWNNGDALATINVNLINSSVISFGLNHTFRSVYQGSGAAGGTTSVGEGQSTGFRLAFATGPNSGLAIGGEQLLQWDSFTDSGRTLYAAYSQGWWLGSGADPFPLLIGTASFATARFAMDPAVQFACTDTGANRTGSFSVDNQLCWAPGGSVALVLSNQLGIFSEYNSTKWNAGVSLSPIADIPLRASWAVNMFNSIAKGNSKNTTTWSFRLSLGF